MEVSRRTIIATALILVGILFGISIEIEISQRRGYGNDGYGDGTYGR